MAATIDPQTILQESETLVNDFLGRIDDSIDALKNFIDGRTTWVSYNPPTTFAPSELAPIPTGELPVLTPAVLGSDFGNPLSEMDAYKGHVFIAPILDQMETTLTGWINSKTLSGVDSAGNLLTSGGVGIDSTTQNAMYQNMRQRDLQALSDALDAIASRDAKRGFAYPTTRRASDAVLVEYQQNYENRSWQITALMSDLAQKNIQLAIQSNLSIESLQASFTQGFGSLFLNLKKLIVETFKVEADERVEEFKAKLSIILAGYQLSEVNGKLKISYQELLLKQWEILTQTSTDRVKSLIAQAEEGNKIQLEAAKALVSSLESIIQAALFQTNGLVAQINQTNTGAAQQGT
jgi:hypothetical protein